METLKTTRCQRGMSQRRLAEKAGISFRTLQLLEAGETDPKLSSLVAVASALGTPEVVVHTELERLLGENPDSLLSVSRRIEIDGGNSWKLWLFNFVDAFRRHPTPELIAHPPVSGTSKRIHCLLASTVESLCAENGMPTPWWCGGVGPLPEPWFVAGVENLKACALVESPAFFRKRNIFVLGNFLDRA